jgi:hypothetical protein
MEVLGEQLQDREIIQNMVVDVAGGKGYELTDEEIDVLTSLLEKLAEEDYDYDEMQATLEMVDQNVSDISDSIEVVDSADDEYLEEDGDDEEWSDGEDGDLEDDEDSILAGLDDSILGDNVISGSTDEKEVADTDEELGAIETEFYIENIASETEDFYEEPDTEYYVENIEPDTEVYAEEPETEIYEEIIQEAELSPDDLNAEDRDQYDRVVKYGKKYFNDSDTDSKGNYKVPLDDETAVQARKFIKQLFLSMKLEGTGDYVPDADAQYESYELNYLDSRMQDLFLNGEETIFENYSTDDCQTMYESIMKFFCKIYDETYAGDTDMDEISDFDDFDSLDDLDDLELD